MSPLKKSSEEEAACIKHQRLKFHYIIPIFHICYKYSRNEKAKQKNYEAEEKKARAIYFIGMCEFFFLHHKNSYDANKIKKHIFAFWDANEEKHTKFETYLVLNIMIKFSKVPHFEKKKNNYPAIVLWTQEFCCDLLRLAWNFDRTNI